MTIRRSKHCAIIPKNVGNEKASVPLKDYSSLSNFTFFYGFNFHYADSRSFLAIGRPHNLGASASGVVALKDSITLNEQ